jgi:hypothetical protein
MVWNDFVMSSEGVWQSTGEGPRYEEVTSTYIPASEPSVHDPELEVEVRRLAREAYDREVAAGRLSPGETFKIGLLVPPSNRKIPAGTTETRWTGALIDFETTDSVPE